MTILQPARRISHLLVSWLTMGCTDPLFVDDLESSSTAVSATADDSTTERIGWSTPTGPCTLDPPVPRTLVLTTTDFTTGAITIVDLLQGTVLTDRAVGSTDAIPFPFGDRLVLVHRYQLDRIDVFDPPQWSLAAQHSLPSTMPSANPQAIAFDPNGLAYITTFADPDLRILDLTRPPAEAEQGRIDLSLFADADGNPEASQIIACGDLLYVTAQRLDPNFAPTTGDILIAIDTRTGVALDLDPSTSQPDALPFAGEWVRQLRRDPQDPRGNTLLALSTGIERVTLDPPTVQWALDPIAMAEAGIGERLQVQAFDVDETGTLVYLVAYDADFSQTRLYRAGLDGTEPQIPQPFADGFDSVERSLELVGTTLWYGSTRATAPGLWSFDTTINPPRVIAGPIATGLPPYSMSVLP